MRSTTAYSKNTGYLVTFSKPPNSAPYDERGTSQGEKKGNKVTGLLHIFFVPFSMTSRQNARVILTRLTKKKG